MTTSNDSSASDFFTSVSHLSSAGRSADEIGAELGVSRREVETALASLRQGLIPFLERLADELQGDSNYVSGWLSNDRDSRYWLSNKLRLSREQESRLMLMPMPSGVSSDDAFASLASDLGLPPGRAAELSALLWRARSLGALRLAARSSGSKAAAAWNPTSTPVRSTAAGRREPLPLAAQDSAGGLSLLAFRSDQLDKDFLAMAKRRLKADAEQLSDAVRRAGLWHREDGEPAETIDLAEAVRVGHVLDWPLALVMTPDTVREARDDLDYTNMIGHLSEVFDWESLAANWTSRRKSLDIAPQAQEGLLFASRGHGVAYISNNLGEAEGKWVAAQLVAAFLHYRIALMNHAEKASNSSFDQVLFTAAMNRQRPWLVLFEERPELGTALRIAAPASQNLSGSLLALLRGKQGRPQEIRASWLAQLLDLPIRVAEQRLAQLSLPLR